MVNHRISETNMTVSVSMERYENCIIIVLYF